MLCEYGCEQEAKFQLKGGKWCCSEKWQRCPVYLKKWSERSKGEKNGFYNKHHTIEKKIFWSQERKISKLGNGNGMFNRKHLEKSKKIMRDNKIGKYKGDNNPFYGKRHSDETKKKWKLSGRNEYWRKRCLSGYAAYMNSFIKNPSIPQLRIYEMVKSFDASAEKNYPLLNFALDVAIPEKKICIEFDGSYWHRGREKQDAERQRKIENQGWKVYRFVDRIPKIEELRKILNG